MAFPSPESRSIRRSLTRSVPQPHLSLSVRRQAWIEYGLTQSLAPGTIFTPVVTGGVECAWIAPCGGTDRRVIVYFHGGGLIDGAISTHRELVSRIVAATGLRALVVGYRLAPENPYPAALEDCLAVCRALHADPSVASEGLVLGGDSSGAGLALATAVELRDSGELLPRCLFTISGSFDATLSGESMLSLRETDPCLTIEELWAWQEVLAAGHIELSSPRLSPLFADLRGLPPILIQVGEHELWLSDSLRIADKISAQGGIVTLRVWEEMWHAWPCWPNLPEAAAAIAEIGRFLNRSIPA